MGSPFTIYTYGRSIQNSRQGKRGCKALRPSLKATAQPPPQSAFQKSLRFCKDVYAQYLTAALSFNTILFLYLSSDFRFLFVWTRTVWNAECLFCFSFFSYKMKYIFNLFALVAFGIIKGVSKVWIHSEKLLMVIGWRNETQGTFLGGKSLNLLVTSTTFP